MATNVKGNWKEGFKQSATKGWKQTKKLSKRGAKRLDKGYGMYGAPTVGLFKSAGRLAMKPVKFALRYPGPTLALGLTYEAAKYLGKKAGEKKFKYPGHREFNKKGRKII